MNLYVYAFGYLYLYGHSTEDSDGTCFGDGDGIADSYGDHEILNGDGFGPCVNLGAEYDG